MPVGFQVCKSGKDILCDGRYHYSLLVEQIKNSLIVRDAVILLALKKSFVKKPHQLNVFWSLVACIKACRDLVEFFTLAAVSISSQ